MLSPVDFGISTELPWIVVGRRLDLVRRDRRSGRPCSSRRRTRASCAVVRSGSVTMYCGERLDQRASPRRVEGTLVEQAAHGAAQEVLLARDATEVGRAVGLCHSPSSVWYSKWRERT